METTTIKLSKTTKATLDEWREHPAESYDDVIRKVVYIAKTAKKSPRLSKEAIRQIEEARERVRRGEYYTWEEVKERLKLRDTS